jgi:hypothetical protein
MRVILSRKGFDSAYGGYPSPILPDGRLISLPIPSDEKIKYSDLKFDKNKSYFDLMKELKPKIKSDKKWQELTNETECHLDPDIYTNIIQRDKEWKACFGQNNASQTHLLNQGVKEGDLFLFFGWFKQTVLNKDKLCFKKSAPDLHIIFGYLQVGKILQVNNETKIPDWMKLHPHAREGYKGKNLTNTIYIASQNLTWDNELPGAGTFKVNKDLVLTKEGLTRSKWLLPDFFKNVKISRHSEKSWQQEGYFKSVDIGQEFIIEENDSIKNWAKFLIKNNRI